MYRYGNDPWGTVGQSWKTENLKCYRADLTRLEATDPAAVLRTADDEELPVRAYRERFEANEVFRENELARATARVYAVPSLTPFEIIQERD